MTGRTRPAEPSTAEILRAWLVLPHFVPILAVLAATTALAVVIAGDALTVSSLLRLLLALLGGQIAVGVANELADANIDAQTKPDKPIPAGLVSRRGALALGVAGLVLMVLAGWDFGGASLALLALGNGIGIVYSLGFKSSRFAWLPYLLALPLLPIWVAVTFDAWDPALLLLYPLGALAVVGVQIAQALPDIAADRAASIDSLTTRLGESRSIRLCWGSTLASAAVAALAAALALDHARWVAASAAAALLLTALNVVLYRQDRRRGVLAAFPCVATAAALLAVGWVAAVTR